MIFGLLWLAVGGACGFVLGHRRGHAYGVAKMLAALMAVDETVLRTEEIPAPQRVMVHTVIEQFIAAVGKAK